MEQKILLIDDSAILRRIATNVLSARAGCGEVITATRASEGFARACASGIGLILVDYQLAGHPDVELCRRLLDEPRTSRVPVVLLLGRGMTPPPTAGLPSNIVDFLVKPFTPEQLVSTVKAVFEAVKSNAPLRRIKEQPAAPYAAPAPALTDHREVAAAASDATPKMREPTRVHTARVIPQLRARVTTVVRGPVGDRVHTAVARLRAALNEAVAPRQTGVLRISPGDDPATELYVENGRIVVVATHDASRYSEEAGDVVPPKVSPAVLDDAVAEQALTGVPFFLTLGSRGLLSKATAVALLHRFGQQYFARLWALPQASLTFEFTAMDALPGFALRLEPRRESLDEWLLGTLRHLEAKDVSAFARQEGYTGTATFQKNGAEALRLLGPSEREEELGRQAEARRDLPTIARALQTTTEQAFLLLFRFRCLGIMEYRPTTSAFVVTPRTSVRRVLPLQR